MEAFSLYLRLRIKPIAFSAGRVSDRLHARELVEFLGTSPGAQPVAQQGLNLISHAWGELFHFTSLLVRGDCCRTHPSNSRRDLFLQGRPSSLFGGIGLRVTHGVYYISRTNSQVFKLCGCEFF